MFYDGRVWQAQRSPLNASRNLGPNKDGDYTRFQVRTRRYRFSVLDMHGVGPGEAKMTTARHA